MAAGKKIGFMKRVWAEAIPFVARSPEMKFHWLIGVITKQSLSCPEISPYVTLLLAEYKDVLQYSMGDEDGGGGFWDLFENVDPKILRKMVECTDLYDIPVLLELVPDIDVEDAILILRKVPPPYEKRPQVVVDKLFQVVYEKTSKELLDRAAAQIMKSGQVPLHFVESYQRFKEMREDEKVLSSLFPQASGQIRVE